jgi:hypothetical protein
MGVNFDEIAIEDYISKHDKPFPLKLESSFPYDRMNPFAFEDITYFTIKQVIENEGNWLGFDKIESLGGIKDKGQDCCLKKSGKSYGVIQCKHSEKSDKLGKTKFVKELIKFLLHSLKDTRLIYDSSNFRYYIFSSSGLKLDAKKLLEDFNSNIFQEISLEKWVNEVINQYSSLQDLESYDKVNVKLDKLFSTVVVQDILTKDFDLLLNKGYNTNVLKMFFSVKTVVETDVLERLIVAKSNLTINYKSAIKHMESASFDFENINSHFGKKKETHLDRVETKDLFNWVLLDLEKEHKNIAILEANAGLGKSVVLKDLLVELKKADIPVLAIKADKYYAKDRLSLEKKLFQYPDIPIEEVILAVLREHQKVVILIDQIDALSQTLSSSRDYLITYNRLIDSLSKYPEVKIVLSIRTFDLNYDSELKHYQSAKIKKIRLNPLKKEEAKSILKKYSVDNVSEKLLELLCVPNHLNVFCRLNNKSKSTLDSLKSLNDLNTALWNEFMNKSLKEGISIKKVLYSIAYKMYEVQQITITNQFKEEYPKEFNFLESNYILTEDAKGIQFFHQTFYDFVFAKQFVEKDKSLIEYIDENGQSLYVRQTIKMVLEYLREYNHSRYIETIDKILSSSNHRFHIKMLCINTLAIVATPTKGEKSLFKSKIKSCLGFLDVFMSYSVSDLWMQYMISQEVLIENLIFSKHRVKIIAENEISLRHNLVIKVLINNLSPSLNRIIKFLTSLPESFDEKTNLIQRVLINSEDWNDKYLVDLFDEYLPFYREYEKNKRDNFWFFQILQKIAPYYPDYVSEKLKPILLSLFEKRAYSTKLSYELNQLLEKYYEIHPRKVYDLLLTVMTTIVEGNILDDAITEVNSPLYKSLYFADVGIKGNTLNADEELFEYLSKFRKLLSISDTIETRIFYEKHKNSNSIPILKLCIHSLVENPSEYSKESVELIKIIHSKSGFQGYDNNFQFLCRTLLGEIFVFLVDSEKEEVIDIIISVKHIYEQRVYEDGDKKRHSLHMAGKKEYIFINSITQVEIQKNHRLRRRYQELKRKFGEIENKPMDESRLMAYAVGAPLDSRAYELMTIEDWEKSFLKFNDEYTADRFNDSSKGGKFEHSSAFKEAVSKKPEKFGQFISNINKKEGISIDYLINGLEGLVQAEYDKNFVISLYRSLMKEELDLSNTLQMISLADFFIKHEIVDDDIICYLSNLAINHENPSGPRRSNDPSFDSLNTVRGAAIRRVIQCYYNPEFEDIIFDSVEQTSNDPQSSVRVGILSVLAYLNHLDLERSYLIFEKLVNTNEIEVLKNSFSSADYYKNKFFERMLPYFNSIIKLEELHENGIVIIAKCWVGNSELKESYGLLKKAMNSSEQAVCAMIRTAEGNIFKGDAEMEKKCFDLLEELLSKNGKDISSRFSGLILRKFKSNNFIQVYPFLKKYALSVHASNEPRYFLNLLRDSAKDHPVKCLNLMKTCINFNNTDIQQRGYLDREPTQVVLAIFSSLSKIYESENRYIQDTLDLFDKLLQNNTQRVRALEAMDSL